MEHDIAAQHFTGFRIFRVNIDRLELRSVARPDIWLPGEAKHSVCPFTRHGPVHQPHENCTCGIHAAKSRRKLNMVYPELARVQLVHPQRMNFYVSGRTIGRFTLLQAPRNNRQTEFISAQMELWGSVLEHEHGYRAEWGRLIPETLAWWPRRPYKHNQKLLRALREKYSVPPIPPWEELI